MAAAPPGLREASLHDYSLSVADGATPQESHVSVGSVWPLTQTGKLLAAGVIGVIVIAASISFQNSRDSKRTGQTLVTPSAALATPTAAPEPPPPAAPKVETTSEPARTEPAPTATATAGMPIESLQKSIDCRDDPLRRDKSGRDATPRSPSKLDKQNKPAAPPPKSKGGIDFGI